MGEQFEDTKHHAFGTHGFEDIVEQVAILEQTLSLDNLSQFTVHL